MNKRRVVVTGMSMLTPVGLGLDASWKAMVSGQSGISTISHFDASALPCTIAGEVKDFDPGEYMPARDAKRMDRFMQLGIAVGLDAFKDSGIDAESLTDAQAERIGVYMGSGIGGITAIEDTTVLFSEKGARKVSPFYIPTTIINMISGNVSIMLGLKGPNLSMVTACSTGTHATGEAARLVRCTKECSCSSNDVNIL